MTISKAYTLLKEQGYLITDRRKGTIITQPDSFTDAERSQYLYDLAFVLAQGRLHQESSSQILTDIKSILKQYDQERK